MDRKTILALGISFLLIMAWGPFVNYLYPPKRIATNSLAVATFTNSPRGSNAAALENPSADSPGFNPASPERSPMRTQEPEKLLVIENENARYTFSSHGGGLKRVELKEYPEAISCEKRRPGARAPAEPLATLNRGAPFPALSFFGEGLDGDGVYDLQQRGPTVRAEKTLPNGLRIQKEFELSTNYLVKTRVRFENSSNEAVLLPPQEFVFGTASAIEAAGDNVLGFYWFDGAKAESVNESYFANRTLSCIPGTPRTEYRAGSSNIVWAAVHNQFFTMLAMPSQPPYQVVSRRLPLLDADFGTNRPFGRPVGPRVGYQTAFVYPAARLGPGQSLERQYSFFAGPKEYNTMRRLGNRQELVMNFGGFFGFFAQALLLSMTGLHSLGVSYGAAIIVITVIIKLLFWPLTNASTKSMKRMAALQPQMNAIREKYKDDPRKMNMKVMEFMKEQKVSPLGGCLPMLLQIPVFFGFFTMIKTAIELRGARFLWVCDLSKPDTLFMVPGLNVPFNLLPLIMGVTMLWQARLTPPSPGVDPVQQKVMKYMPLMMMVFLYNFSAGLTLYWTVQNLLSIAQMKLTRAQSGPGAPAVRPAVPSGAAPAGKKKKDRQP